MEKVDEWVLALSSDNGGEIGLYRIYATKSDMKNFIFRMIKRARAFETHGAWKHGPDSVDDINELGHGFVTEDAFAECTVRYTAMPVGMIPTIDTEKISEIQSCKSDE